MFGHIFGRFLVEQKMISQETLEEVLDAQRKVRVKLGLIAVSEKLLTQEQADKINRKQALEDKRFGDIAVEMGYLTESQVSRLFTASGEPLFDLYSGYDGKRRHDAGGDRKCHRLVSP